jgi:rubrerythrin
MLELKQKFVCIKCHEVAGGDEPHKECPKCRNIMLPAKPTEFRWNDFAEKLKGVVTK